MFAYVFTRYDQCYIATSFRINQSRVSYILSFTLRLITTTISSVTTLTIGNHMIAPVTEKRRWCSRVINQVNPLKLYRTKLQREKQYKMKLCTLYNGNIKTNITGPLSGESSDEWGILPPNKETLIPKAFPCHVVIIYNGGYCYVVPFIPCNILTGKASIWFHRDVHTQFSNVHSGSPWHWVRLWNSASFWQIKCTISYLIHVSMKAAFMIWHCLWIKRTSVESACSLKDH